jgi:hypothetical protein
MKTNLILILLFLFSACSFQKSEKEAGTERIVRIEDEELFLKNGFMFNQNKALKIYDVSLGAEISRTHYYVFCINREKNYESTYNYNKFSYNWINDTTLKFRVFSTSHDRFAAFEYKLEKESFSFKWDTVNHSEYGEKFGLFMRE